MITTEHKIAIADATLAVEVVTAVLAEVTA